MKRISIADLTQKTNSTSIYLQFLLFLFQTRTFEMIGIQLQISIASRFPRTRFGVVGIFIYISNFFQFQAWFWSRTICFYVEKTVVTYKFMLSMVSITRMTSSDSSYDTFYIQWELDLISSDALVPFHTLILQLYICLSVFQFQFLLPCFRAIESSQTLLF